MTDYEMVPVYTRDGAYVSTVMVPKMVPPPERIIWGVRLFARDTNGNYIEGIGAVPLGFVTDTQQPLMPIRFNP